MTELNMAPKVRELIEKLRAAIQRHWGFVVELRSAKSDQRSHEEQLELLRSRIEERHMELARSGSLPPEEPFEEETLITKVTSKTRFYAARVQLCQESVSSSKTEIQALKDALWPAFREFGTGLHQSEVLAFEEAARACRSVLIDVFSIKIDCDLPVTTCVPGIVIGTLPISGEEGHGTFLDTRRLQAADLGGDIHEALQALRTEILQMVACQIEPPLSDLATVDPEQITSGLATDRRRQRQ